MADLRKAAFCSHDPQVYVEVVTWTNKCMIQLIKVKSSPSKLINEGTIVTH